MPVSESVSLQRQRTGGQLTVACSPLFDERERDLEGRGWAAGRRSDSDGRRFSHSPPPSDLLTPTAPRTLLLHSPLVLCYSILPSYSAPPSSPIPRAAARRRASRREGANAQGEGVKGEGGRQGRSASEGERQRLREAASQCRNGLRYVDAPGSDKALTEEEAMTEAMAPR